MARNIQQYVAERIYELMKEKKWVLFKYNSNYQRTFFCLADSHKNATSLALQELNKQKRKLEANYGSYFFEIEYNNNKNVFHLRSTTILSDQNVQIPLSDLCIYTRKIAFYEHELK
jgi:hypothetical protein